MAEQERTRERVDTAVNAVSSLQAHQATREHEPDEVTAVDPPCSTDQPWVPLAKTGKPAQPIAMYSNWPASAAQRTDRGR